MSEIVFFLGAGASEHCGTPLMKDFLSVARQLYKNGIKEPEPEQAFKEVLDAINGFNAIHSKATLDFDNIESVYTTFEMGRLLGKLPGIKDINRIEQLTQYLRKLISYTLEYTTRIPVDPQSEPFKDYRMFCNLLSTLVERNKSFTIITFNYDMALDYTLLKNKFIVDYGLNDTDFNKNNKKIATILKLHGSLNFGRCTNGNCQRIVPYRQFNDIQYDSDESTGIIPILEKLNNTTCTHCGSKLDNSPVIIPPTWNKTAFHDQIRSIWQQAATALEDVESIFVIGYSLPKTDWFFNYLFGLGVEMSTPIEQFIVYDPIKDVETRFSDLLGPGVKSKFQFINEKFDLAIPDIQKSLGLNTTRRTTRPFIQRI